MVDEEKDPFDDLIEAMEAEVERNESQKPESEAE